MLIVTSSWPRTGDELAGTFVRSDAIARAKGGARVVVAAPMGAGTPRGGRGVEVIDVAHLGLFGAPGAMERLAPHPTRIVGLLPFARDVAAIARRFDPQHVVAHWIAPAGLLARAVAGERASIEIVAHGGDVRLLEGLPRALARLLLDWTCDERTRIRAVSDSIAARLLSIEPRLARAIFVRAMPLAIDDARERARSRELRAASTRALYVVAARLIESKRLERAIDRVPRGETLVLIGDGPRRDALTEHARACGVELRALGALPHEEALAWIAAADVVLAPLAKGEGAPTVVREARALGVRVEVLAG